MENVGQSNKLCKIVVAGENLCSFLTNNYNVTMLHDYSERIFFGCYLVNFFGFTFKKRQKNNHINWTHKSVAYTLAWLNQASFDHVKVGPTPVLALRNL